MLTILNHGVYNFNEVAALTRLKRERIRELFRERSPKSTRQPIIEGDYQQVDGHRAISFLDLIDVFVAGQLREHGVSLQTLRKVYEHLGADLNTPHPFSRKELLSDGKIVFLRGVDTQGLQELEEVLTHQKVFSEFILPFLKRLDYDKVTRLARRWQIADGVVVDPAICLGKPIVESVSIPTALLAGAYHANNKDANAVADWYNIKPEDVEAAVQFQKQYAA